MPSGSPSRPRDVAPRTYDIPVRIVPAKGRTRTHTAKVRIHDVRIRPRRGFAVGNWFYNDALLDFYGCAAFDARYWAGSPNYVRNVVEHGQVRCTFRSSPRRPTASRGRASCCAFTVPARTIIVLTGAM